MKPAITITAALTALAAFSGCQTLLPPPGNAPLPGTPGTADKRPVHRVDTVTVDRNHRTWVINARGLVNTGGWTEGELVENFTGDEIRNGTYGFMFVARPPSGPHTMQLSKIDGWYEWAIPQPNAKRVRVSSASNEIITGLRE